MQFTKQMVSIDAYNVALFYFNRRMKAPTYPRPNPPLIVSPLSLLYLFLLYFCPYGEAAVMVSPVLVVGWCINGF